MCDSKILAEMVNQANYAAMSYNELVTLNFAYLLAEGDIKPLIEKKRAEEMERHTDEFVKLMDNYGASKDELLALIVKKALRDKPYGPTRSQNVDEPTPTANTEDYQDNGKTVLALPASSQDIEEQTQTVDAEDYQDKGESVIPLPASSQDIPEEVIDATQEERPSNDTDEAVITHQELAKRAIELAKLCNTPDNIDVNAPYFVDHSFNFSEKGDLCSHKSYGRNLKKNDLESYRLAAENYYRLFLEKEVTISTDDCLVIYSGSSIIVTFYKFPTDGEAKVPNIDADGNYILDIDEKELKRRQCKVKNAIQYVKDNYTFEGMIESPYYERFSFKAEKRKLEYLSGPKRFDEDAEKLPIILNSFETYARFNNYNNVVMSKDNYVVAMTGRFVYLVRINTPVQEKKRKITKKIVPVTKDTVTPTEDPLISKAVEITKSQPIGNEVDINAPYFVQCDFSVMGDGELFQKGKPFIKDVSGEEELGKLKRNHLRFAKTMKAVNPVSTERYTAYFWNEGKNLSVFYYNTKGLTAAA